MTLGMIRDARSISTIGSLALSMSPRPMTFVTLRLVGK
jgi:hypothetical protein